MSKEILDIKKWRKKSEERLLEIFFRNKKPSNPETYTIIKDWAKEISDDYYDKNDYLEPANAIRLSFRGD